MAKDFVRKTVGYRNCALAYQLPECDFPRKMMTQLMFVSESLPKMWLESSLIGQVWECG